MKTLLMVLVGLALMAPVARAAEGRPKSDEIKRKVGNAHYDRGKTIDARYKRNKNDVIRFQPADLDDPQEEHYARGEVLGVLDIDKRSDNTGLRPGKYYVFVDRQGERGKWRIFFTTRDGDIVREAQNVDYHKEPTKRPKFHDNKEAVDYWHWEFTY